MTEPTRRCLSCAVVSGERETLEGVIVEDEGFHAHQDVAYPIPGLVILAAKRHVRAFDELTEVEAESLARLIRRIRAAQREVLGIEHVYYFYNEDTTHHFHVWMVPRYEWMQPFGRSVESVRPVLVCARVAMASEENMARVADAVRRLRAALRPAAVEPSAAAGSQQSPTGGCGPARV